MTQTTDQPTPTVSAHEQELDALRGEMQRLRNDYARLERIAHEQVDQLTEQALRFAHTEQERDALHAEVRQLRDERDQGLLQVEKAQGDADRTREEKQELLQRQQELQARNAELVEAWRESEQQLRDARLKIANVAGFWAEQFSPFLTSQSQQYTGLLAAIETIAQRLAPAQPPAPQAPQFKYALDQYVWCNGEEWLIHKQRITYSLYGVPKIKYLLTPHALGRKRAWVLEAYIRPADGGPHG